VDYGNSCAVESVFIIYDIMLNKWITTDPNPASSMENYETVRTTN